MNVIWLIRTNPIIPVDSYGWQGTHWCNFATLAHAPINRVELYLYADSAVDVTGYAREFMEYLNDVASAYGSIQISYGAPMADKGKFKITMGILADLKAPPPPQASLGSRSQVEGLSGDITYNFSVQYGNTYRNIENTGRNNGIITGDARGSSVGSFDVSQGAEVDTQGIIDDTVPIFTIIEVVTGNLEDTIDGIGQGTFQQRTEKRELRHELQIQGDDMVIFGSFDTQAEFDEWNNDSGTYEWHPDGYADRPAPDVYTPDSHFTRTVSGFELGEQYTINCSANFTSGTPRFWYNNERDFVSELNDEVDFIAEYETMEIGASTDGGVFSFDDFTVKGSTGTGSKLYLDDVLQYFLPNVPSGRMVLTDVPLIGHQDTIDSIEADFHFTATVPTPVEQENLFTGSFLELGQTITPITNGFNFVIASGVEGNFRPHIPVYEEIKRMMVSFYAVVNTGTWTIDRYYDGTQYVALPNGEHTIVGGYNEFEMGNRSNANNIASSDTLTIDAIDVDILKLRIWEINLGAERNVPDAAVLNGYTTDGVVHLYWNEPEDYGEAIINYTIIVDSTNLGTTTDLNASITGLTNGQAYTCEIIATNANGDSPLSNQYIGTPAPALINGDFSNGSTGWGGLVVTAGVAQTDAPDGLGTQVVNGLEIGVEHKIYFDCDNQGASPALKVYTDTQAGTLLLQVNTTGTGMNTYSGVFTPTTDTIMIELANTNQASLWDNIELLSNDLVVNGDFATDLTGWTGINADILFVTNQMEITSTTTTYVRADQIVTGSAINTKYRIDFDYVITSAQVPYCGFGTFGAIPDSDTGTHQVYRHTTESADENLGIGINTGGTIGDVITIDNVTVRRII